MSLLFFLKLTIVPLFILLVTLAGKRFGDKLAGLLGGLPVVAGPIVVFMLIEQGRAFGISATLFAMSSAICLLCFNLAYSWSTSILFKQSWWFALPTAWFVWSISAYAVSLLPVDLYILGGLVILSLVYVPLLLPKISQANMTQAKSKKNTANQQNNIAKSEKLSAKLDIFARMLTGALLTVFVTGIANTLGDKWSGLLAVFPIIGTVLAIFTHINSGYIGVVNMHRGMVKGLYSLVVFFGALHLCLLTTLSVGLSILTAILCGLLIQVAFTMVEKFWQ